MAIDSMAAPHEDDFISIYSCDRLTSSLLAVDMGDQCGLHGDEDGEGEPGFNHSFGLRTSDCRSGSFVLPEWLVRFDHSGMDCFRSDALHQGIENGGPFIPGDTVCIIAGIHRGTVARVYGTGQHETVRVELGEAEREQYTDFFSAY